MAEPGRSGLLGLRVAPATVLAPTMESIESLAPEAEAVPVIEEVVDTPLEEAHPRPR